MTVDFLPSLEATRHAQTHSERTEYVHKKQTQTTKNGESRIQNRINSTRTYDTSNKTHDQVHILGKKAKIETIASAISLQRSPVSLSYRCPEGR